MFAPAIAAAFSCSSDTGDETSPKAGRTLTVNGVITRTTIEYEGSDVSHLVWKEGDEVAYVTGLPGQTFKTAAVSGNRFTAEIPSGATDDDILAVLWPSERAEGLPLKGITAELPSEFGQEAGAAFDGSLLPMYACVRIPATGTEVDADYRPLGSVIRFSIDAAGHETETLRSVTLSADEYLAGKYTFDTSGDPAWTFTGTSKTVRTTVTGEAARLDNRFYIYMAVNPAAYTGVEVRVETDAGVYVFPDGTMDLNQKGRTLYRVSLPLEETPKPEKLYYTQVTDMADLTPEGKYLIVADRDESSYHTPDNKSYTAVINPTTIGFTGSGVEATDATALYTWKIEKNETSGMYSLFSTRIGQYVGSAGAILVNDYGKFFFTQSIPQTPDGEVTYYWNIEVDAQKAVIKSLRLENACFQYNAHPYAGFFCLCTPDTDGGRNVRILKLREN